MVYGLTFARFLELIQLASKAREEEAKEKLINSAFIGWQMGAGGKVKFGAYLSKLGLTEGPVETKKKSPKKDAGLDGRLKSMGIVPEKDNKK